MKKSELSSQTIIIILVILLILLTLGYVTIKLNTIRSLIIS